MVQAGERVDTQQRAALDRARWYADQDQKDLSPNQEDARLTASRYMLVRKLPLEALLQFRDTWFAPESEVDVTTPLILNEASLQSDYRYNELLLRAQEFKELPVSERREQLNPIRANPLYAVLEASNALLLDHDKYLAARNSGSDRTEKSLVTTPMAYGSQIEAWLGSKDYSKIADKALFLRGVIKEKKRKGTRVAAINSHFNETLELDIDQVTARVKQARGDKAALARLEVIFGVNMTVIESKLKEVFDSKRDSPFTLKQASAIYAIGRLVMRFIGDGQEGSVMGVPLTKAEKQKFRSEILGSFF